MKVFNSWVWDFLTLSWSNIVAFTCENCVYIWHFMQMLWGKKFFTFVMFSVSHVCRRDSFDLICLWNVRVILFDRFLLRRNMYVHLNLLLVI